MYAEKYYHIYCDKHGDEYRVSLQEWNYSGASTEVECGVTQFVIDRQNQKSLAIGGVYPTRATATFVSEGNFDLEDLYTANEKTYLLVRYKNGQLNWQGNVVADGFSRKNWDARRDELTVMASDNLSTLQGIPFTDAVGENYGNDGNNIQSFLWAIKEGLKKTGFNLNIWTFCDLKTSIVTGGTSFITRVARGLNAEGTVFNFNFTGLGSATTFSDALIIGSTLRFQEGALSGQTFTIESKGSPSAFLGSYYVFVKPVETVPAFNTHDCTVSITSGEPQSTLDDPLSYTNHDVRTWIRDTDIEGKSYYEARGGAYSTWEVLDAIARQWGVKIYQNNGHWEVLRWNADKLPDGDYQWFVYNSEGTPIGREPFGGDRLLPCRPTDTEYRIFGSNLSMDRVLRNVIVNYRYKYKLDGDTLQNLMINPNFSNGQNGWFIYNLASVFLPSIQVNSYSGLMPPGFTSAITVRNISNRKGFAQWSSMNTVHSISSLNSGDVPRLSWWEKMDGFNSSHLGPLNNLLGNHMGVYQFDVQSSLKDGQGSNFERYNLVLSGISDPKIETIGGQTIIRQKFNASWEKRGWGEPHTRFGSYYYKQAGTPYPKGLWRHIEIEIPPSPITGFFNIEILGAAVSENADRYFPFPVAANERPYINRLVVDNKGKVSFVRGRTVFNIRPQLDFSLITTGWQLNKIVDPSNEAVPQIDPFMYPDQQAQLSRQYTDTIDEIEVLTGDDYGEYTEDRISGMTVEGVNTSMWDTWDNRFGWSRQGLITAKSIMELYWTPTRLLQAEISMKDLHWSSRIQFEELPGRRFVILSGNIGGEYSTFRGVLKEIHDDAEAPLPPGGQDGGNTTEPNWQSTGTSRCVKDDDGLNTGRLEILEVDANQASPTYGQERWRDIGEDLGTCPIGEPIDLFWGTQFSLNVNTLNNFPYTKIGDTYSVQFSNDGGNAYLRLLHRADIGTIRSIFYDGGFESISGWEYEPDVLIEGYTYKHIRLTWFVGIFSNISVNFVID